MHCNYKPPLNYTIFSKLSINQNFNKNITKYLLENHEKQWLQNWPCYFGFDSIAFYNSHHVVNVLLIQK